MTTISMDKQYTTRLREPVRLVKIDAQGAQPVCGYVITDRFGLCLGGEYPMRWPADGRFFPDRETQSDLIDVEEGHGLEGVE